MASGEEKRENVPFVFVGDGDNFHNIISIDSKYGAKKLKELSVEKKKSIPKKRRDVDATSSDDVLPSVSDFTSPNLNDDSETKRPSQAYYNASIENLIDQCLKSHATAKALTSDHTLKKNKHVDFHYESLHELLKKSENSHAKEKKRLCESYRNYFDKWYVYLVNGFNILLHGAGSKFDLINEFHKNVLVDEDAIVVHGFFTGLTLKNILNRITEDLLEEECSFSGVQEQAEFVCSKYNEDGANKLFLVIHSLDAAAMRDSKFIFILCQLAKAQNIHIIASVDHINSPLLWDSSYNSCFKWLWFEVNTFATYKVETSNENSLLNRQGRTLALSSLHHVFKSLTPNAQSIFILLARNQVDHDKESNYLGISFPELFCQCREAFLVNSDLTLRTQLIEFKDHNMLHSRKAADGVEHLTVPINNDALVQFIESQEAN